MLAAAVQRGVARPEFQEDLEEATKELAPGMQRCTQRGEIDQAWRIWLETVRTVGQAHFAQKPKGPNPETSELRARRLELARVRSQFRADLRG
eukprot:3531008-Pyramimonas_sp.AAC.1